MQRMKAMTFREKQTVLRNTFDEYQRAKVKLHCLEMNNFYPEIAYHVVREASKKYNTTNMTSLLNSRIDDKDELAGVVRSFEYIISLLTEESKRIIENDFIFKKKNGWWREYYAKTTYYRLKTRAMEEMLFYLNVY
ncbi:MAG: MG284/MPN403 family protein [Coprobacillaceae bacterium]